MAILCVICGVKTLFWKTKYLLELYYAVGSSLNTSLQTTQFAEKPRSKPRKITKIEPFADVDLTTISTDNHESQATIS